MLAALLACAFPAAAHEGVAASDARHSLSETALTAAATVDAFHAALRKGDTRAAAALLADDALIFEAGGVERSKAEYQASHLLADAEFSRAVPAVLVRRSGQALGNLAWISSHGRVTGRFRGKPVARATTENMVLRRDGAAWKIVHIHWTSGPLT
jgi:ketosteroid isomerase-like protein